MLIQWNIIQHWKYMKFNYIHLKTNFAQKQHVIGKPMQRDSIYYRFKTKQT